MAYNITIEFMDGTYDVRGNPKTAFNLGDVAEVYNHGGGRRGSQVDGTLVSGVKFEFTIPPTTPRKFFMHVLGVPDLLPFETLKEVLMEEYLVPEIAPVAEPHMKMERFRRWNINHAGMNPPDKAALETTRQVTFNYAKFQNAILDKTGNNNLFTDVIFA